MRYQKYVSFAMFVLLLTASLCFCEVSDENVTRIENTAVNQSFRSEDSILRKFAYYQKMGRVEISKAMRKLRKEGASHVYVFLWLFVFSFGYGIFHAVGPGHGPT